MKKVHQRIIIHVDMDAFFASVEQREHPEYQNKPVIIGADPKNGSGRGVVSTASYEARKYGIHSAQPISQAYRLCPHGIFLPVRAALYAKVSQNILRIFEKYSPLIEPISLDEAFIDISGTRRLFGDAKAVGLKIKEDILKQERLIASIGIGPNKLIAKIGSDLKKPDGFVIVQPGEVKSFLNPLPVGRIWGVGKKTEAKLHAIGIQTIGELAAVPEKTMTQLFGKMGSLLQKFANGIDDSPVISFRDIKSVSNEITFDEDVTDRSVLHHILLKLSEKMAYRLRRKKCKGKTVILKIRYANFSTCIRHNTLQTATNQENIIFNEILFLFNYFVQKNQPVRLLGVGITKLISDDERQVDLFHEENANIEKVSEAVDAIKSKYGDGTIQRGGYDSSVKTCIKKTEK